VEWYYRFHRSPRPPFRQPDLLFLPVYWFILETEKQGVQGVNKTMAFYAFYLVAIVVLVLHFTGWLARNNLEWVVLVLAVATFPAVIFLK